MRFKAVIFDLDGTLLNTLDDLADSTNYVLEEYGCPIHDTEAYRYFIGDGFKKLIERTLPDDRRDASIVHEAVARLEVIYGESWAVKTKPYRGIPQLLDRIAEHDLKMVVLSNKPDGPAKQVVAHFFRQWNFEIVLGSRPAIPNKPDPTTAVEISRTLDIPPEEFLFLGDTGIDMQTAVAANMYAIGVLWGFRGADELIENGAQLLVRHPGDLMFWL
ncbi:HAD family hydrolase [Thermodesulfobacteriota bacterium]